MTTTTTTKRTTWILHDNGSPEKLFIDDVRKETDRRIPPDYAYCLISLRGFEGAGRSTYGPPLGLGPFLLLRLKWENKIGKILLISNT